MWWWNARGYTSAGVEAWNCIRALDYLQSRPEVDPDRIGVTGRSGGGAYSWWIAALDERIKAAVPVAGITSLENHVVDGCVEGHCDCMYMVNTYRWDFPLLAALVAPRPLLISNTDKDRIFPLDGVVDVYTKARRIYELYGKSQNIGLQICEGPHKDTQQLRIPAFHWFNKFLKEEDPLIETVATKLFEPQELKVFKELPDDERNTKIQETFTETANSIVPENVEQWTAAETAVDEIAAGEGFPRLAIVRAGDTCGSFCAGGLLRRVEWRAFVGLRFHQRKAEHSAAAVSGRIKTLSIVRSLISSPSTPWTRKAGWISWTRCNRRFPNNCQASIARAATSKSLTSWQRY